MQSVQVVGSGPNGLAAALVLQRAGASVTVHERAAVAGGGLRSEPLTLPGHVHDSCAAVHPLATAAPFFREYGIAVAWVQPAAALAHPFDDGTAALLLPDVAATAATLDAGDRIAYARSIGGLAAAWPRLAADVLAPPHVPREARAYAAFARLAIRSAHGVAMQRFRGARARALWAGLAAYGTVPLERPATAAFALVLALCAHNDGWPLVRGGSHGIADALLRALRESGGQVRVATRAEPDALRAADAVLLDVAPAALGELIGEQLSARRRREAAAFPYGPGVHKVEWALAEPIPWRTRECALAGTVHLGGTLEEIAAALRAAAAGEHSEQPFVLLGQPTLFDDTRAPAGQHNAWAYCAVPRGSGRDVTTAIERQVERFAPGFRELILARHTRTAAELQAHNPNLVGGSIAGSGLSLRRFLFGDGTPWRPYETGVPGWFLCSAYTPPGPGVHGMCGYHAARQAVRWLERRKRTGLS